MTGDAALLLEALEVQRAILNAALEFDKVVPGIEAAMFSRHANGVIWSAIKEAAVRGLTPAYPIVRQILVDRGHIDAVGEAYLRDTSKDGVFPRPNAIACMGDMLRTTYRERQLKMLVCKHAEQPGAVDLDQLQRDLVSCQRRN
jgi:hypothetical protein